MPKTTGDRRFAHLICAIAARDREALHSLHDLMGPPLYAALTTEFDEMTAADLLEGIFTQIWAQADGFSPDDQAATEWLRLVVRKALREAVEARGRPN